MPKEWYYRLTYVLTCTHKNTYTDTHTHTHPSVHVHMKSFGTLGKQGEKKKTTSVFVAHDANNTSSVWFISGSAHQRASLGECSALQEPFLGRGVWTSKSRSRGNLENKNSPLQVSEGGIQESSNHRDVQMKWNCGREKNMRTGVEMRVWPGSLWFPTRMTGSVCSSSVCDQLAVWVWSLDQKELWG